eukprot:5251199-Amphidinium_carterae.1
MSPKLIGMPCNITHMVAICASHKLECLIELGGWWISKVVFCKTVQRGNVAWYFDDARCVPPSGKKVRGKPFNTFGAGAVKFLSPPKL